MRDMTEIRDGRADFDFLIGAWTVRHQRLKVRLAACEEWLAFDGTCEVRKILGGQGNMDDNVLEMPGDPYTAVTTRLFDPRNQTWSIYWIDSRNPVIEPPVRGRFEGGAGLFMGDDTFNGRLIKVRFIWSDITATSARWAQAFSTDAGETWETNWIMDFSRAS